MLLGVGTALNIKECELDQQVEQHHSRLGERRVANRRRALTVFLPFLTVCLQFLSVFLPFLSLPSFVPPPAQVPALALGVAAVVSSSGGHASALARAGARRVRALGRVFSLVTEREPQRAGLRDNRDERLAAPVSMDTNEASALESGESSGRGRSRNAGTRKVDR